MGQVLALSHSWHWLRLGWRVGRPIDDHEVVIVLRVLRQDVAVLLSAPFLILHYFHLIKTGQRVECILCLFC